MEISVIICTHNPRAEYLRRVLDALERQTLPQGQWELLLIDNASEVGVPKLHDLSSSLRGKTIREEKLGLTLARLRGIEESTGEIVVFVDDDNVLEPDYLHTAVSIAARYPQIGAFGGSLKGEFETPPESWMTPYLEGLAVFTIDRDYWSNLGGWSLASPYGAGLCVRRCIADDYVKKVARDTLRRSLDRSGIVMGSGGDGDLAWCAVDLGLGTGRFAALRITHLIPKDRLTAGYIVRLMAGFAASGEILSAIRKDSDFERATSWKSRIRFALELLTSRGIQRRILWSSERARKEARHLISSKQSAV